MSKARLNPQSLERWNSDRAEIKRYQYDNIRSVIDIGGCVGDWYKNAIYTWPKANFVVFEPTDFAIQIPMRLGDILVRAAAWMFDGNIELGGDFFATGLYEDNPKIYQAVDITHWLKEPVDLIKVNIEGSEYPLLEYMILNGLTENIKHLQVQFHEVEGIDYKTMYDHIAAGLERTHTLSWRYPFCWESWELKHKTL